MVNKNTGIRLTFMSFSLNENDIVGKVATNIDVLSLLNKYLKAIFNRY